MIHDNRNILHLDLDTFFVSVERLLDSRLNNKPVIVGGLSDRSVVTSCSYETRLYGVHAGMPMKMALRLCPDAKVIRGNMEEYSKQSHIVTEIIGNHAPLFEKASIDEYYIDLTGMERFFGCMKWSQELKKYIIRHAGLPISFGLSPNKTVSKIATGEAKPDGGIEIPKSLVQAFLNPLPIKKIPGIGNVTNKLLRQKGIDTIQALSATSPEMIESVLGKNGLSIWQKANGIDNTPIKQYYERKSIGTEHTMGKDTNNIVKLNEMLIIMVEKTAYELRKQNKLTSTVTVKIRYSDFTTHTLQKKIQHTSLDHKLIDATKELFKKLYNKRLLIRLIGMKFSNLVYGHQPPDLFENTLPLINLYREIDLLRKKFGYKIIRRAVASKKPRMKN